MECNNFGESIPLDVSVGYSTHTESVAVLVRDVYQQITPAFFKQTRVKNRI